jgi:hypothetical protein
MKIFNPRNCFAFLFFVSFICEDNLKVYATKGWDVSSFFCSSLNYTCLFQEGYRFGIIQTWTSGDGYNTDIKNCTEGAWNAGMDRVDVYISMCPQYSKSSDPSSLVSQVHDNLQSEGVKYVMIWFVVEQLTGCWDTNLSANAQYLTNAASEATSLGINYGTYSDSDEWLQIVGNYTGLSSHPLWYAHFDNETGFNNPYYWTFGGWTTPAMKQYNDASTRCGNIDEDWYPDSSPPSNTSTTSITTTNIATSTSSSNNHSSTTSGSDRIAFTNRIMHLASWLICLSIMTIYF